MDHRTVYKSGSGRFPPFAISCTLDANGRVVEVPGRRLRYGNKLIVGPEYPMEVVESLGERAESNRYSCGNSIFVSEIRTRSGIVFEATAWDLERMERPPWLSLEKILEHNPEYRGVRAISIHDHAFYNLDFSER